MLSTVLWQHQLWWWSLELLHGILDHNWHSYWYIPGEYWAVLGTVVLLVDEDSKGVMEGEIEHRRELLTCCGAFLKLSEKRQNTSHLSLLFSCKPMHTCMHNIIFGKLTITCHSISCVTFRTDTLSLFTCGILAAVLTYHWKYWSRILVFFHL